MAGIDSSWTGVCDVTPHRNPAFGPPVDIEGLVAGFGFFRLRFKLSLGIGKILAYHMAARRMFCSPLFTQSHCKWRAAGLRIPVGRGDLRCIAAQRLAIQFIVSAAR
jgi:hypothetical protein